MKRMDDHQRAERYFYIIEFVAIVVGALIYIISAIPA
jgi:hypothetical protein